MSSPLKWGEKTIKCVATAVDRNWRHYLCLCHVFLAVSRRCDSGGCFKYPQLLDDGQGLGTDTLYPPVGLLTRGQFVLNDAANTKARKSWAAARWLAARLAEIETRASTCCRVRKTQKVWTRLFAVQMINELGGVCWPRESEGWAPAVHLSCWLQSRPDRSWLTLTDWATPFLHQPTLSREHITCSSQLLTEKSITAELSLADISH